MTSHQIRTSEAIAAGLTVAAVAVAAIKFAPRLFASAANEDAALVREAVPSISELKTSLAAKGLNFAESGPVPSFADLQAAMAEHGLSAPDLAAAESGNNYINHGFHNDVFEIPKLSNFVLRVPREWAITPEERFELNELFDPAPEHNFGQPIAQLGHSLVLKKVAGRPYGMFRDANTLQELSDMHAAEVRMAAKLPQSSYDHLAARLRIAAEHGLSFDGNNSHNLLFEEGLRQFNPIDFSIAQRGETVKSTLNDMLRPLIEPPGNSSLPAPSDWLPAAGHHPIVGPNFLRTSGEPEPLQAEYRAIVDKSFIAAQRAGLSVFEDDVLDDLMRSAGVNNKQYESMFKALYRG
ncbi:MAG TPA: hypothetical protein V6C81_29905 [Planktothrix sp.]|jgi:hypothetical protein